MKVEIDIDDVAKDRIAGLESLVKKHLRKIDKLETELRITKNKLAERDGELKSLHDVRAAIENAAYFMGMGYD